ncbi:hypothetical protein [Algoriphagus boritolerans]|uniref:hypothetical protein n=1 Tax=Algoriphagus boritolerans TaxID=308111 RepID=UPI000B001843
MRFGETGGMRVEEWATVFTPSDANGNALVPEDLPLVKTISTGNPAFGTFFINSLTGERIQITVSSFPIMGRSNRLLGSMAMFWKTKEI